LTLGVGDLVVISDECDIKYFGGKTAIVIKNVGQDATDHSQGQYYQLQFANGSHHIFTQREIILLSKAERKNNENR
jgi:hypothetical protein